MARSILMERPSSTTNSNPAVTDIRDWDSVRSSLRSDDPTELVVLAFMASWSEPWKEMKPILRDVASEVVPVYKVRVYTLDVDKFKVLGQWLGVEAIPTFILVKNKRVTKRVVGVKRKDELKNDIVSKAERKGQERHDAPPQTVHT